MVLPFWCMILVRIKIKNSFCHLQKLLKLVGVEGFEPSEWWSQSPLPYRLATPQYLLLLPVSLQPTILLYHSMLEKSILYFVKDTGIFYESGNRCCKKNKKAVSLSKLLYWLGWKDLNPRNDGVRVHCLTAWLHPSLFSVVCISRLDYYITIPERCQLISEKQKKRKEYRCCSEKSNVKYRLYN